MSMLASVLSFLFAPARREPATVAETVEETRKSADQWVAWAEPLDENELRTAAYYLAEADGFRQHPDVYWNKAIEAQG